MSATSTRLSQLPRPAPPNLKKDTSLYVCTCAALGIKPNSRLLAMGEDNLLTSRALDLTNNYIGGVGFQALTVVLAKNNCLQKLVVAGNGLSNESVVYFCREMSTSLPAATASSSPRSTGADEEGIESAANGVARDESAITSIQSVVYRCPSLKMIDFSNNPLSLPAANALLHYATTNPTIEEIHLEGTNIEPAILRKINRCLNLKKTRMKAKSGGGGGSPATAGGGPIPSQRRAHVVDGSPIATNSPPIGGTQSPATNSLPLTPYERVLREQKVRAADKRAVLREQKVADEMEKRRQLVHASPRLQRDLHRLIALSIPRSIGGFTVLNLAISSTPSDFVSELRMIFDVIVPSLNVKYGREYGVLLNPTTMYGSVDPHAYEASSSSHNNKHRDDTDNDNNNSSKTTTTTNDDTSTTTVEVKGGGVGSIQALTGSAVPPAFTQALIADARRVSSDPKHEGSQPSLKPPTVNKLTTPTSPATTQPVAIVSDYLRNVHKGIPFFLQLIGERIGLPQYDPSLAVVPTGSGTGTTGENTLQHHQHQHHQQRNFTPIAQREYGEGAAVSACAIVMVRAPTATLGVPAPLLPRMTDDPSLIYPDEHSRAIREAVATAGGSAPRSYFDIEFEKKKWAEHLAFVDKVKAEHTPSSLLCGHYPASFAGVDREGNVLLTGLDKGGTMSFSDMLGARLSACLDMVASAVHGAQPANQSFATSLGALSAGGGGGRQSSSPSSPKEATTRDDGGDEKQAAPEIEAHNKVQSLYYTPSCPTDAGSTVLSLRMPYVLHASLAYARKTIASRLDLYAVNPPSRNMTLLCSNGFSGQGISTTLKAFAAKCLTKSNFYIAHHSVRDVHLLSEPSDQRTLFLNLMKQLSYMTQLRQQQQRQQQLVAGGARPSIGAGPSSSSAPPLLAPSTLSSAVATVGPHDLPSYIVNESSIEKLRDYFMTALARASGDAGENGTIVIIVDGLDDIDPIVVPCASLKVSDTGVNMWDPPAASPTQFVPSPPPAQKLSSPAGTVGGVGRPSTGTNSNNSTAPDTITQQAAEEEARLAAFYSFIPLCLAKNVRFVGSCLSQSAAHKHLAARGHDSCDPVAIGPIGDYEVESFLKTVIRDGLGVSLSEETKANLIANTEARTFGYLQFVAAACERFLDTPTAILSADLLVSTLSPTMKGVCDDLLSLLEAELGEPFVRKALSYLLLSRWGLTEIELGDLMLATAGVAKTKTKRTASPPPSAASKGRRALGAATGVGGSYSAPTGADASVVRPPSSSAVTVSNGVHSRAPSCRPAGDTLNKFIRLLRPVLAKTAATSSANGAANACENILFISNKIFAELARERYVRDPLSTHQQLAHYYRKLAWESTVTSSHSSSSLSSTNGGDSSQQQRQQAPSSHPLEGKAIVECGYHLTSARLWPLIGQWLFSVKFVSTCYERKVGHRCLRELIRAYNAIDAAPISSCPEKAILLAKGKEYVYFARDHTVNLTLFPRMGYQIAITSSADTFLHKDAKEHFTATATQRPHFIATGKSKTKTHRDTITAVCFAPSGARFATCSDDRTISIFTANGDRIFNISHSSSKMKKLIYSKSSRYLVGVSEDRTTFVFDAASGNLVSKFHGHNSIIRDVAMSCRGRFVATVADDRCLKIWEAETGALCVSVPHTDYIPSSAISLGVAGYGVNCVVADPFDEFVFYVSCHSKVVGWRLDGSKTKCEALFSFSAHSVHPASSLRISADGNFIVTCVGHPAYDERREVATTTNTSGSRLTNTAEGELVEASTKIWHLEHHHLDQQSQHQKVSVRQVASLESPSASPVITGGEVVSRGNLVTGGIITTTNSRNSGPQGSTSTTVSNMAVAARKAMVIGTSFAEIAPDERTVAVAMVDGTVCVYHILWEQLLEHASRSVRLVKPSAHFPCFANHPVIHIQQLVYSHDGSMLAVTGNSRQIKVVNVRSAAKGVGEQQSPPPLFDDAANSMVAEYLLEAPLICMAWSPCPQEGAPEIVIGDSVGRLHALRLERPTSSSQDPSTSSSSLEQR